MLQQRGITRRGASTLLNCLAIMAADANKTISPLTTCWKNFFFSNEMKLLLIRELIYEIRK